MEVEKLVDSCRAPPHAALDSGPVPTEIPSFFLNQSLASVRYYEEMVKRRRWPGIVELAPGIPDLGPSVITPGAQMAPNKYGLQSCACTMPVASQIFPVGKKKQTSWRLG